jgi:hypothetical protein
MSKKITFREMRDVVRGNLIYCADYHCSHALTISGDRWTDNVQDRFASTACGNATPTFGPTSSGTQSRSVCWFTSETREMHDELVTGNSALWRGSNRLHRGG